MRVKIVSTEVISRTIKSRRTGNDSTFREQVGVVQLGKYETREINVPLERDQAAYPLGEYDVLDSSFTVNQYKRLEVGRLALRPVASAVGVGTKVAG